MKEFQPYFYLEQQGKQNYKENGNLGYILLYVGIIFLIFDFFAKVGLRDFALLVIGLGATIIIFTYITTSRSRSEDENRMEKEEKQQTFTT